MCTFIFGMKEAGIIMLITGSDKCFSEILQQKKVPLVYKALICSPFPVSPYSLCENSLLHRTS